MKPNQTVRKETGKRNLEKILDLLSQGSQDVEELLCLFWQEKKKYRLTLKEIGTTQKELNAMRKLGHSLIIREQLCFLRSGECRTWTNLLLHKINESLKLGGLTLRQLDSSRQDLKNLTILNFDTKIQDLLQYMSRPNIHFSADDFPREIAQLRISAKCCSLKPADLNLPKKEIQKVRKLQRQNAIRHLRHELLALFKYKPKPDENSGDWYEEGIQNILYKLKSWRLSLSQLKITKQDIERHRPKK